jgi:hypothetical protein
VQHSDGFGACSRSYNLFSGKAGIGDEKSPWTMEHFTLFPDDGFVPGRAAPKPFVPAKQPMVCVQRVFKKILMRSASQAMNICSVIESPVYRKIRVHFFKHLIDLSYPIIDRDPRHRAASIRYHVYLMSPV